MVMQKLLNLSIYPFLAMFNFNDKNNMINGEVVKIEHLSICYFAMFSIYDFLPIILGKLNTKLR